MDLSTAPNLSQLLVPHNTPAVNQQAERPEFVVNNGIDMSVTDNLQLPGIKVELDSYKEESSNMSEDNAATDNNIGLNDFPGVTASFPLAAAEMAKNLQLQNQIQDLQNKLAMAAPRDIKTEASISQESATQSASFGSIIPSSQPSISSPPVRSQNNLEMARLTLQPVQPVASPPTPPSSKLTAIVPRKAETPETNIGTNTGARRKNLDMVKTDLFSIKEKEEPSLEETVLIVNGSAEGASSSDQSIPDISRPAMSMEEDISPILRRTKSVKRNRSLSLTATSILEVYDWMHDLDMEEGDVMEIEDLCRPGAGYELTYEPSALPPYPHCSTRKCLRLGKPPKKKTKRSPVKNNINKSKRLNKSNNI